MLDNICKKTDSYKVGQWMMIPRDTEYVYSYLEARAGGRYPEVSLFGLQYILKKHFSGVQVTRDKILQADDFWAKHFGRLGIFNRAGWEYILRAHGGRLPLRIKAVAEGLPVPESNVLVTAENTDPKVPWLTNWCETILSQAWYPSTVHTNSREGAKILLEFLKATGDPAGLWFKYHDFGYRGVSCVEQAAIGGAAHLSSGFMGTDTAAGLEFLAEYYGCGMAGLSIPASEHSCTTIWGEGNEDMAVGNCLVKFPEGLLANVGDSYDFEYFVKDIVGKTHRKAIQSRKGVFIVRPDSGYPPEIVCLMLKWLGNAFGFTVNDKGFRVLPDYIRGIQGDGIDNDMLRLVLQAMMDAGWSADNMAFGSGGGLLMKHNRDSQNFAFKNSWAMVGGEERDVYKAPKTDPAKNSKRGRLVLTYEDYPAEFGIYTIEGLSQAAEEAYEHNLLCDVFLNGSMVHTFTIDDVRRYASIL